MRGLLMAAAMAPTYAQQHNTIENTFDMLSLSVSNSIDYLLNIPINMGSIETFLSGKSINAPLSSPIVATASGDMAASGSLTQQTLWGSVVVENLMSFVVFEDTGVYQYYTPTTMTYRDNDPASCPATTSTIPSENTGAAHEQARTGNCLTSWHVDAMGVKTTSFSNMDFDPRTRSWYTDTKAAKAPTWSSVYQFVQMGGKLGITYSVPLYSTQSNPDTTLLGLLGFDLHLDQIERVLEDNNIQNVVQYIVSSATNELLATSVGEQKLTSTGGVKLATHADNFIIRESAAMLARMPTDGFHYYESLTDDSDYVMKVTSYSQGSSLSWKIIAVTEEDHVPEMSVKASIVLADLTAALDDLTQNTESLAYYLEFMAGKSASAPLSAVILENSTNAQLSSVTHQTLWGAMNTFPEVADVMVTYANKKMFHFHEDNTKMFFRDSGSASTYNEYAINAQGTITGGIVSSADYDPTTEPFYTLATETAAFTSFFADPSDTPSPEIAFSLPFFSSPHVLDGVISTTMTLKEFEDVLAEFADPAVAYFILDEANRVVATSYGEKTWDATGGVLISGATSSNILVRTASAYIMQNSVNVDNTFILQNENIGVEDMIVSVKRYTDFRDLLHWRLVSVQYYDEDAWATSSDDESDDEAATAAAIVMGSLLFITISALIGMLALGKLTCSGAKDGETERLGKTGAESSEKL